MISSEKYKEVLDNGLTLDHYHLLCSIRDGTPLVDSKRVQGFLNLLTKKGYIEEGKLTEKALEFMIVYDDKQEITVKKGVFKQPIEVKLGDWVTALHGKCQDKLLALTGKKQVVAKINKLDKKGWPYLCNAVDMGKAITSCINNYKLKDYAKIEKTILSYIDRCASANVWFPVIQYYIIKNGMSPMVTDMDNDDPSTETDYKSSQKFV